ncbi:MAG: sulfite exporter TauE/SafE family protein [Allobranchiibius sp.]
MNGVVGYLLLGVVVAAGALVQSVVGFGLAVVAAPVVVFVRPDLLPAALLFTTLLLPIWELASNERDIAWRLFGAAIAGRLALLPVGVWLVANASARVIAVIVGVMVLVAVAGSLTPWTVRAQPIPALAAGLLTGISGTAASIGGPFFGLVLQHERPARVRSTLAAFFVVGATSSLVGLAVAGQVSGPQFAAGVGWIPFVVVGAILARPVRARVGRDRMRRGVLAVSAIAGILVLARAGLT